MQSCLISLPCTDLITQVAAGGTEE
jgi:hypothetical protein